MDLDTLQHMAISIQRQISRKYNYDDTSVDGIDQAKTANLMSNAGKLLPEHSLFLNNSFGNWANSHHPKAEAIFMIDYLLELLNIEKTSQAKASDLKIFDSANDKMKQAGIAFQKSDYHSVINNLNTAMELLLKDKLEIPMTIREINTAKIIDVCVAEKIGPYAYLVEAKKHVCGIDNRVKHSGYSPTKGDCILAIQAMEQLVSKLRGLELKLEDEVRKKIYHEL